MNFDRANDPNPIDAQLAVKRGVALVNVPVRIIMVVGLVAGALLIKVLPIFGFVVMVVAIPCAWLWWSYFVPQWRNWAHRRGVDPEQLQYLAECTRLVWPKGSIFERTEFRRGGR